VWCRLLAGQQAAGCSIRTRDDEVHHKTTPIDCP
jgi:hypothetical protein